jgi:hypothetical protein
MAAAPIFDPNDDEQAQEIIDRYAAQLHEHGFDSVRIFVTSRNVDGSSRSKTAERGQWYASFGAIVEWLDRQRAKLQREVQQGEDDE